MIKRDSLFFNFFHSHFNNLHVCYNAQVNEPVTGREEVIPTGQVNVWTGRRLREFRTEKTSRGVKNLTAYRCHPKLDEGWTRGERGGNQYCCIYFAR